MRVVGLKVLKDRLSEYVRLAAGGEVVLIANHDRIVAELVPPRESRSPLLADAMLAAAIREGVLTPAVMPPGPPPDSPKLKSLDEMLADLETDRGER
ncbi:MAG: prevent-host-death protein [Deltaproteobacteria bacterium RIFOXYA12_FULL_58_15]|nr:MAG: prevent-host-death protein [Deltaproteobacteria bacterium RIFOXYA12_FULL_58_15]OGR08511.1 MAG: prevent-host-death protein [Deltaproteobacteria bacterium RIFOXYB12_FULL_58_9]